MYKYILTTCVINTVFSGNLNVILFALIFYNPLFQRNDTLLIFREPCSDVI